MNKVFCIILTSFCFVTLSGYRNIVSASDNKSTLHTTADNVTGTEGAEPEVQNFSYEKDLGMYKEKSSRVKV